MKTTVQPQKGTERVSQIENKSLGGNSVQYTGPSLANGSSQSNYLNDLQLKANNSSQVQGLLQLQRNVNAGAQGSVLQLGKEDKMVEKEEEEISDSFDNANSLDEGIRLLKRRMGKVVLAGTTASGVDTLARDFWNFLRPHCDYNGSKTKKEVVRILGKVLNSHEKPLRKGDKEYLKPWKQANNSSLWHLHSRLEAHAGIYVKESAGSGWEKYVMTPSKKPGAGMIGEVFDKMDGRTATRYGYTNGGQQGPHTLARCLGLNLRSAKLKMLFSKDNYEENEEAIFAEIEQMYSSYTDPLADELKSYLLQKNSDMDTDETDLLASMSDNIDKIGEEILGGNVTSSKTKNLYTDWVKRMAPNTNFAKKYITKEYEETGGYNPGLHALKAFEFYRKLYTKALGSDTTAMGGVDHKAKMLIMWGQILADLHPYATSFKDNASFAELKGGGESSLLPKLEPILEQYKKESGDIEDKPRRIKIRKKGINQVKDVFSGGGSGKGGFDMSTMRYIPIELEEDFVKYHGGNIKNYMKLKGMDDKFSNELSMSISTDFSDFLGKRKVRPSYKKRKTMQDKKDLNPVRKKTKK